jgi:SAM-dependent methyltransferase
VTSAAYWDARVEGVLAAGLPLYRTVYDGPGDRWLKIQEDSADAVLANVPPGASVLDVGCGYGALIEAVAGRVATGRWVGIDVSPRMIGLAQERRGPVNLWDAVGMGTKPVLPVMDGRDVGFGSDSFDWCVCRGLEGSVRVREGNAEWRRFRSEMLRVAPRALLLDYSGGAKVLRREDYV